MTTPATLPDPARGPRRVPVTQRLLTYLSANFPDTAVQYLLAQQCSEALLYQSPSRFMLEFPEALCDSDTQHRLGFDRQIHTASTCLVGEGQFPANCLG